MKIAVIGGGASGLMAAAAAKTDTTEVIVYERLSRVGKKILATGNGRCNMTNINAGLSNYHGRNPEFVRGAMKRFWVEETLDFFCRSGILAKVEEEGKVYPYSDTASSVLDVLRRAAEHKGAVTECNHDVKTVIREGGGFRIVFYDNSYAVCDRVIIAAGGRAAPSLGSNGSGYSILKDLGHTITPLYPSLVQIKTDTGVVKKLKGIKVNAIVTIGGNSAAGEVLFTDYGLSGPPVFSLTSTLGKNKSVTLDIMPEYGYSEIVDMITERCQYLGYVPLEEFFTGMLNKRVGQAVLKSAGIAALSGKASALGVSDIKKIAGIIKKWQFEIKGTMSWNNAQVTKGGALTSEFDEDTLESKKVKGLYACGEVLDIDGDCGGYNLQWAWSSGYLAGLSASKGE